MSNLSFFNKISVFNSKPLGMDIGNSYVKIAQIKTNYLSKTRSLSFSAAEIKADKSRDKVIEAIRQAYRDIKGDSKKVNISICGQNIIIHYLILPVMKQIDLYKSIEFELEKYIPYKREDVVIDFYKLANLADNKMVVLLVAAERRIIEERISLVKEAGLEPQSISVDAMALSETFKTLPSRTKGVAALLDIGYRLSKLIILEDDVPYFSRDIETGEYNIIQAVSKRMSIHNDRARELIYNPAGESGEIDKLINFELNSLFDELSLSFEYCERNLEKKVSRLYLTGGGSRIRNLSEPLKKNLDLNIDFLDPLRNFKVSLSPDNKQSKESSPFLAVAIGLALS